VIQRILWVNYHIGQPYVALATDVAILLCSASDVQPGALLFVLYGFGIFVEVTVTWPSRLVSYLYSGGTGFESLARH
jgi:hypothetical protein